jgi:UDP-glucose 4-epimerase
MRVVVTGATGNVGMALTSRLSSRGDTVVAIARHHDPRLDMPNVVFSPCDIGSPEALPRLAAEFADATAVVHLAWAINPESYDAPMRRTNIAGSANVLRAADIARAPHLVCASSAAAYGGAPRWLRVAENHPVGHGIPGSAYSVQKAEFEAMLDGFAADHPGVVVGRVRPCGIVAPEEGGRLASWLLSPLAPRGAFGRLPLPTWPGMRFQLVGVDDVAAAIERLVDAGVPGAFNIASEPVLRPADFGAAGARHVTLPYWLLSAAAAASWRVGVQPLHPGWLRLADRSAVLATVKVRRTLGWKPTVSGREALAQLVSAVRAAPDSSGRPQVGRPLRQSQN